MGKGKTNRRGRSEKLSGEATALGGFPDLEQVALVSLRNKLFKTEYTERSLSGGFRRQNFGGDKSFKVFCVSPIFIGDKSSDNYRLR
ncbi:hypothetical protein VB735_16110 [Halotia wernerae UHCC 0503]|nr:hypothetical protein [Halotia wernerae UHCC 0503]